MDIKFFLIFLALGVIVLIVAMLINCIHKSFFFPPNNILFMIILTLIIFGIIIYLRYNKIEEFLNRL